MTSRRTPRGTGLDHLLRLAVLCAITALTIVSGPPVGAGPRQTSPAADPAATMRVTLQDLEIDPSGTFRVVLEIANAPGGSNASVRIFDRISDLGGLTASATDQPSGLLDTFDSIPLATTDTAVQATFFAIFLYERGQPRPTGAPANWTYQKLDEAGVYPIEVRLRGPDGEVLTSIVTYLVRRPGGTATLIPADVALVTTVDQSPQGGGGEPGAEPVDGSYRTALDRVLRNFAARPELPMSFAVTPELAERLDADPDATATLDALRTEIDRDNREVIGAPYVRIDPAALVANNLADEVIRQRALGDRALTRVLGLPGDGAWLGKDTWLVDRPIDATTVDVLADLAVSHLVVSASAVAVGTPKTRLPLPGSNRRVDAITTTRTDLTTGSPTDPILAAYQLLGRLAATASINPRGSATVLRIDPEAADPVELDTVLSVLSEPSIYLRPTTLARAFTAPLATQPPSLTEPDTRGLNRYSALARETHRLLSSYASMAIDQPDLIQAFERPLARSAAVGLELSTRRDELDRINSELGRRLGAISTPAKDRVTLGARNARFPLPITSTLVEPAKVIITLQAPDRLSFPSRTIEATLSEGRTVVDIPVSTRATGDTPLRITVRTPDGNVVLSESQYTVRSTAVSGVGLVLTIGAAGFLALWWGRHWHRGRHRSRHGRRRHPVRAGSTGHADDAALFVPEPSDVTPTARAESNPG